MNCLDSKWLEFVIYLGLHMHQLQKYSLLKTKIPSHVVVSIFLANLELVLPQRNGVFEMTSMLQLSYSKYLLRFEGLTFI